MAEVLRGDLGGVSMASVLQLVELECFCGALTLAGGALRFHNGDLVGGDYLGLTGREAALEALVRARGPFALQVQPSTPSAPLAQTAGLVIESCRIQDELDRLGPAPIQVVDAGSLSGELARVGAALGAQPSLAAAIAASGARVTPLLDPLLQAVEKGWLKPGAPSRPQDLDALWVGGAGADEAASTEAAPAEAAPAAPPAARPAAAGGPSFDDLVFDARKHVRARAWHDAEDALRRALELRPGSKIVAQNLNRVRSLRAAEAP